MPVSSREMKCYHAILVDLSTRKTDCYMALLHGSIEHCIPIGESLHSTVLKSLRPTSTFILHEDILFVYLCFPAFPVPAAQRPVLHPPEVHPSPWPETTKPAHQWHRRAQTGWLWWVCWKLMLSCHTPVRCWWGTAPHPFPANNNSRIRWHSANMKAAWHTQREWKWVCEALGVCVCHCGRWRTQKLTLSHKGRIFNPTRPHAPLRADHQQCRLTQSVCWGFFF